MASNFGISVYRFNKNLQLKLSGDFDAHSALQLLSLMRNCIRENGKIFIHTDSIINIDPSGLDIFRFNMGYLARHPMRFVFTGENAPSLIETWPDNSRPELKVNGEPSLN